MRDRRNFPRHVRAALRWLVATGASCSGALAPALRADIEFIGIFVTSRATQLSLKDTATGKTAWVEPGAAFAGWTVSSFNPKDDTILLRRGTEQRRVRLKDSKVEDSAMAWLSGEFSFRIGETTTVRSAQLVPDREQEISFGDGSVVKIKPSRDPSGNLLFTIAIKSPRFDDGNAFVSAPRVQARPGQPFALRIGDFEIKFAPTPP